MELDRIAGHDRLRAELKRAVSSNTPAHAYMFTGPAGVGKTATALAFALDLLAAAGAPRLRGETSGGVRANPDLWLEDSEVETISIETLRRDGRQSDAEGGPAQPLQAFLSLRGMYTERRVAVIARAERLLDTAAAVLLKTIEEPPPGAVIVLCAEASDLLPATIRSRCRPLDFQRLPERAMEAFLDGRRIVPDPAVLHLAAGAPGIALRLTEDPSEVERLKEWEELLESMVGREWLDVIAAGAVFAGADARSNRARAREALQVWEAWLRDLSLRRTGASELARAPVTPVARNVWTGVAADVAVRLWSSCRVAHERVKRNVNPRLAIEVFLGDVAFAARRAPVVESTDPPFHRPVLV